MKMRTKIVGILICMLLMVATLVVTGDVNIGDDTIPPTTTIQLSGEIGNQGWYVSNVEVTLIATDEGSGVNYTRYKLDDGNWTNYTILFNVNIDGYHTVYYYSVDYDGNVEEEKSRDFKIDQTPPTTTHTFSPPDPDGENGWYVNVSSGMVTLSASDNTSGCTTTWYRIDEEIWKLYTKPFVISSDGWHTVQYYTFDVAGNQEDTHSIEEIKIDRTKPETTYSLTGELGDNGWYVSDVEMELISRDATSGIWHTYYRIEDGEWQEYTDPFVLSEENEHVVEYYSVDMAGNEETHKSATVKIDKTGPTIDIRTPLKGYLYFFGVKTLRVSSVWSVILGRITIEPSAIDIISGIDRVEFYVDGMLVSSVIEEPYTWNWNITSIFEPYILTVIAYNQAGFSNSIQSKLFVLTLGGDRK